MTKSLTNKLYLKYHTTVYILKKHAPMKDYINKLNKAILDLRNINVPIDDENQALILLCLLPLSYKNYIDTML